jgi:predicted nucleotidyltransferase
MNQEELANIVVETRDLKSFCNTLSRLADDNTGKDSFKFTEHHLHRMNQYAKCIVEITKQLQQIIEEHGEDTLQYLLKDELAMNIKH